MESSQGIREHHKGGKERDGWERVGTGCKAWREGCVDGIADFSSTQVKGQTGEGNALQLRMKNLCIEIERVERQKIMYKN